MNIIVKAILKYVSIFVITAAILFSALVLTAKIPNKTIRKNIEKSGDILKETLSNDKSTAHDYNTIHYYADTMILNIINYIDSKKPVSSVMEAKYYSISGGEALGTDLKQDITENSEPNTQYIRYWHGSMSILRPLLIFFNIGQMYIGSAILLSILTIMLLFKVRRIKELFIAIIIGLIMCYVHIIPFCIEYVWTFLIMLISSIIAIEFEKKEKNTNIIFFITGILTCYLDFLTTEIITLFVPIIIILTLKYENKKITCFKDGLKFTTISVLLWSIGYFGMWFAKWILASIILKDVNIVEHIIKPATRRINGTPFFYTEGNVKIGAIIKNVKLLFPIQILLKNNILYWVIGCILGIEVVFVYKKDFKKLWFSLLLILIAVVPYLRYIVLANHSYDHFFFTFRIQLISVISIVMAICYSLDKEKLKNILKRKNRV